jgi:hypothetical protein
MAPGRLRGLSRPGQTRSPLPLGMPHVPLARTSARTPDPGRGWSNLHIFMQTCGEARGTFLWRTDAPRVPASPYPWHVHAARGPKPPATGRGPPLAGRSGVEGLPGEKDRARQALRGTCARYPIPDTTDHGFFHPHNRETMLFASFS